MGNWENYLNEHQSQYLQELSEFLRIPSISSLPEHAGITLCFQKIYEIFPSGILVVVVRCVLQGVKV